MIALKYKSPILITLLSLFIFGFTPKAPVMSTDDILLRSRLAILNIKTMSYDCSFNQKFAGGTDTLKTKANIAMERKNKDTIMGCNMKMNSQFVFFSMAFKTELFYNGKKNIALNHTKKKATIDTTGIRGRGVPTISLLKQNFPTANMMKHYTEKLPYEAFFKYTNKITMEGEEKIGAYTCYKLEIQTQDPDSKKRIVTLFIDKQSYLPIRRIDLVDFNKKYQYSEFTLSAIKVNDVQTTGQIREPSIPKDYDVDYYRADRF